MQKIRFLIKKLVRDRRLGRDEWNFLLTAFFTTYGIGALAIGTLVDRPASFKEIEIALVVFFPVFLLLFLLKSFRKFLVRKSKWRTIGAVLLAIFGLFMFSGLGIGYVGFVNAITAAKDVRLAAGRIERMEPRRRDAPRVYLNDGQSTISNVPVSDEEFDTLRIGDYYVSNLRLGGLGLYYRWRIDSWNRGWEAKVRQTTGEMSGKTR
ncbi:hypothetical protein [Paraburkholderia rhizosphaerae]|nr:hypothetical protein [Paraburkholderia rhizosphaerae]